VLIIPGWAIGTAFVIVVVAAAQVVMRRLLGGRVSRSAGPNPTEPDLAHLTQALDDVQRRLGELEERLDFAERLLAKDRVAERLSPPHG
jgi:hypothetical protein